MQTVKEGNTIHSSLGVRVCSKQDQDCGRPSTHMETWRFVLVCAVYLNLPINLVSGLAMPRCVHDWLDIPDENTVVIKCNNIPKADTVKWTLENEAENQTIFHGFCGSANGLCNSSNTNDMYLERRSPSDTSLFIFRNHRNYGGLRMTCSTKTEIASCTTNVIHSAEMSSCRTEITLASWQLTVTCDVDNFFSSNKPGRCGVTQRVEAETQSSENIQTFNCPLLLQSCTNQTNLQIYQKGNCSCTIYLPDVIGNYSFVMKVLPGAAEETAGEVRIDKLETDCTIFMKENPGGSCKCYQRDPGSFSTSPDTGETASYVCNLVRTSSSQTGGPTNNTCETLYPPKSPPIITGNEDGSILTVGGNKTLTCTVRGGKPLVSSVIFVCGNESGTPDFGDDESVSSSVNFVVQAQHHNSSCECSAIWQRKTDLYSYKAYTTLNVKEMILTTTEGETEETTEFLSQTRFVTQVTKLQVQEIGYTDRKEDGQNITNGQSVVTVVVAAIVAFIVVIAVVVAAVVYVHKKKQNQAHVARSSEVEKPKEEFIEQVNMVYVSADMLGFNTNSAIIGLRQSRADDSIYRPTPHESSEVPQRLSTPQGLTQTALKEHDRKRESTTSENFYSVVEDKGLAETHP